MGITGFTVALAFAAGFVWYTRRRNALTLDGALTAAFAGLWVMWWAGPGWLLPLFFFFVSSTLLGRLNKNGVDAADAKHGRPRDYRQVLCNGGIYTLMAIWAPGPLRETALTAMTLSIAVSTADTWSSEIGQYFRQKTMDIWRWQPVPVGLSGGVSMAGSAGGLAGALSMAMLGYALSPDQFDLKWMLLITAGGFGGMLLDSLLGATLQARYRDDHTGALSDQRSGQNRLFSGMAWMSNDGVNFWSNALVTFAGIIYG